MKRIALGLSAVVGMVIGAPGIATPRAATPRAAVSPRQFPTMTQPGPFVGDSYPDRVTHFPGGVTSLANVVYSVIPGYRAMTLDIYMPPKTAKSTPKPLILYVHGGGWLGGNPRASGPLTFFPGVLAALASEGFVVASVDYRLSGEAAFPAQLQDVRAALRFMKANAAKYGVDPSRSGVWGASAGGHLAGLLALTCGDKSFDVPGIKAPAGSECVQTAVTWYGVFDLAKSLPPAGAPGGQPSPVEVLLGCRVATCPAETVAHASPITHVDAHDPPMMLMHGTADKTVNPQQSHDLEARLKAAGVPVESLYIDGADHSWLGADVTATRGYGLRATNAAFDYFHRQLDRK